MNCISNVRCSSCGSVIGDKFISFSTLVDCGYTNLEAFVALDIFLYCCRAELSNPIILTNKSESTRQTTVVRDILTGEKHFIPFQTNIQNNRLTSSVGKEIAILNRSDTDSVEDESYLDHLKQELKQSLVKPVPVAQFKVIDVDSFIGKRTNTPVGSGMTISIIHKAYDAT